MTGTGGSESMDSIICNDYSQDLSRVEWARSPRPVIKSHQILVQVHAAGANPADVYTVAGMMLQAGWKISFPFCLGFEFSGKIEEVGSDVSDFAVGDEVCGLNWGNSRPDGREGDAMAGCFAEYVAISQHKVSKKPPSVSHQLAAGVCLAGSAAYQAVHSCGKVGQGARALILGGATVVGALAIQLCKLAGASFVATTCSSSSVRYVSQFKPDLIIPYDKEKWHQQPQCRHFDFVLDLAGAASTLERLKSEGNLITIGAAFVSMVNPVVGVTAQAHPPFSYARFYLLRQSSAHQDYMLNLIAEHKISLPIDAIHTFTKEEIVDMLHVLKAGKAKGKHIVKIHE